MDNSCYGLIQFAAQSIGMVCGHGIDSSFQIESIYRN